MEKLTDPDIRELLKRKFTSCNEFTLDSSTVVVDELDVCYGSAIVDVAVVNGKLHGYEIKSERDNLDRLPSQMEYYNRVFDMVTLVASSTHIAKARLIVPNWWGLDCATLSKSNIEIRTIRKPKLNKNVQTLDITQLLWREELMELLSQFSVKCGVKSKTRHQLGIKAVEEIDHVAIADFVRYKLKSREGWKSVPIQRICDDLQ